MARRASPVLLTRRAALPLAAAALAGCTGLLFQPMRQELRTPGDLGLAWQDVELRAADGTRLHAWLLKADGARKGTVLFLHGNAENISTHIGAVSWMPAAGYDVLLPDYRGYGRSEGRPTMAGVHLDAQAALDEALRLDPGHVIVFGQSMGGSIAIDVVAAHPRRLELRALVVEGAVASFRDLARLKLASFWPTWPLQLPLALTIDDGWRAVDRIGEIAPVPVLIVQGEADLVVPVEDARRLYAAAGEPRQLWLLPGVGHIQAFARPDLQRRLAAWLDDCVGPKGCAGPA